jgi:ABC-type multidrug transport system permease subunit
MTLEDFIYLELISYIKNIVILGLLFSLCLYFVVNFFRDINGRKKYTDPQDIERDKNALAVFALFMLIMGTLLGSSLFGIFTYKVSGKMQYENYIRDNRCFECKKRIGK